MTTIRPTPSIKSARLDLRALTPEFMESYIRGDIPAAQQILDVKIPAEMAESIEVLELRLRQLQAAPDLQPWLLRAICLRATNTMIGHIGFHTQPNPHYLQQWMHGAVEFGFEVFPAFRRQGYAREASQALMYWANTEHGVNSFVLSIAPQNQASQALAAGLGFTRIGSHMDVVDGLEDVLTLAYTARPK